MYLNDACVDTTLPRLAHQNFIDYLRSIGTGVILVAHNGFRISRSSNNCTIVSLGFPHLQRNIFSNNFHGLKYRFDAPMILRSMREYGLLDQFRSIVKGFADTLILFRDHLPDRKKEKKSYSQTALAEDLLDFNAAQGAHNAVNDVLILSQICSVSGLSEEKIKQNAKATSEILYAATVATMQARNKQSLLAMKETVSAGMISKMAKAGITMQVLETVYVSSGAEGFRILLGEDVRGKPRVTKNNKIFKAIVAQVEKAVAGKNV